MESVGRSSSPSGAILIGSVVENHSESDNSNQNGQSFKTSGSEKRKMNDKQTTQNKQQKLERSDLDNENDETNRINTTSFSVMDILDPGKFTGTNHSRKIPWKRWGENEWSRLTRSPGEDRIRGIHKNININSFSCQVK